MDALFPNGYEPFLIGGAFVALSALVLYVAGGKMMGSTTGLAVVWNALVRGVAPGEERWRVWFAIGTILGGALFVLLGNPSPDTGVAWWRLLIGGVFVGVGARMAGGCTSGHGIGGAGARDLRAIVIVIVFIVVAMVTARAVAAV